MGIEFLDELAWLNERRSVLFFAKADAKLYRCFLAQEALDRHFGGSATQDYVALLRRSSRCDSGGRRKTAVERRGR